MKAILSDKRNRNDKLLYCVKKPVIQKDDELVIQIYATAVNAGDYGLMNLGIVPKSKI